MALAAFPPSTAATSTAYKMQSGSYSNLLQSVTMLDPLTWNSTKSYYTRNYSYDSLSRLKQVSVLAEQ